MKRLRGCEMKTLYDQLKEFLPEERKIPFPDRTTEIDFIRFNEEAESYNQALKDVADSLKGVRFDIKDIEQVIVETLVVIGTNDQALLSDLTKESQNNLKSKGYFIAKAITNSNVFVKEE